MSTKRWNFLSKIKKALVPIGICSGITLLCLVILIFHYQRSASSMDFLGRVEAKLLDFRFLARGTVEPTGKVGILAMDEKSVQKFGRWPFARSVYAKAFANLKSLGVDWIGFDVVWSEPENALLRDAKPLLEKIQSAPSSQIPVLFNKEMEKLNLMLSAGPGDQSLAQALRDYEKIVQGYFYIGTKSEAKALGKTPFRGIDKMEDSVIQMALVPEGKKLSDYRGILSYGLVASIPFVMEQSKAFGFFSNEADDDAIIRWITMVQTMDEKLFPSMSLMLASKILNRAIVVDFAASNFNYVSLVDENTNEEMKIPIDPWGRGRMLINHRGPSKTIPHFSLADAYDNSFTPAEKKSLKGMNLIMGPTATAINDQRANPFDATINGVESHAAALDNMLRGDMMQRPAKMYETELLIVLLVGLLFSPLVIFGRAAFSGAAMLAFIFGYYYFDKFFWFNKGTWAYIGMPMFEIMSLYITTTFYKYLTEEKEKAQVTGIFGKCLSPDVVNQVLENPDALKLGGERKELTVFFSDVRSFTTISESLTPEQLCALMNDYFTPMAAEVLKSGGTLDKYIGDAIMAFWGAPIDLPDHADRAALSAIQMLFELEKLQPYFKEKYDKEVNIGIGLNSGSMSVGMMGSAERMSYTVMGDNVNLGSRLEGLTKDYGIKAMISEFTRKRLTRKDIFVRDLDDIRVKGKLEPVNVYELMRPDIMPNEQGMRDLIGEFELGRAAYKKQDWNKAKSHFEACMRMRDKDGPSTLYLERIEKYIEHSPGESWDGVYTFKHK